MLKSNFIKNMNQCYDFMTRARRGSSALINMENLVYSNTGQSSSDRVSQCGNGGVGGGHLTAEEASWGQTGAAGGALVSQMTRSNVKGRREVTFHLSA